MSSSQDENAPLDEEKTSAEVPLKDGVRTRSRTAKPGQDSHSENEKSALPDSRVKAVHASRAIKRRRAGVTPVRSSIHERAKTGSNSYVKWPLERRAELATQIALLPGVLLQQLLPPMWAVLEKRRGEISTMQIAETGYVFDFLAMGNDELDSIEHHLLQCP